jgi:hypothetical protein
MQYDTLKTLVWESDLKAPKTPAQIASKHAITPDEAQSLIDDGAIEEKEHTMNLDTAKIIASHHLYSDKDYYVKLKKYVETDK